MVGTGKFHVLPFGLRRIASHAISRILMIGRGI
jgi:hypothetical protein